MGGLEQRLGALVKPRAGRRQRNALRVMTNDELRAEAFLQPLDRDG